MATTEALVKLMSGLIDLHQYCLVLEQVIDIQRGVNDSDVIISDGIIAEQLSLIANRAVDLAHEFVPATEVKLP